jgi:hypothetical protein
MNLILEMELMKFLLVGGTLKNRHFLITYAFEDIAPIPPIIFNLSFTPFEHYTGVISTY